MINSKQQFFCVPMEVLSANLSNRAMKTLLGLLSYRNQQTGQCNPKLEKLCERLGGMPRRTLFRGLQELRLAGILEARRHEGASFYVFHMDGFHTVEKPPGQSAKSGTPAVPDLTLQSDKFDTFRAAHPYMNRELNREGNSAAAVTLRDSVEEPVKKAAAAGSSVLAKSPNAEQLALDLEEAQAHPASQPDSAEALARELVSAHPQPGLPRRAVGEVQKALGAGWSADAIRARHAEWCAYWATVPPGRFIPMLWRWFDSGDFESKPVVRKPPVVESYVERFRRQLREA